MSLGGAIHWILQRHILIVWDLEVCICCHYRHWNTNMEISGYNGKGIAEIFYPELLQNSSLGALFTNSCSTCFQFWLMKISEYIVLGIKIYHKELALLLAINRQFAYHHPLQNSIRYLRTYIICSRFSFSLLLICVKKKKFIYIHSVRIFIILLVEFLKSG